MGSLHSVFLTSLDFFSRTFLFFSYLFCFVSLFIYKGFGLVLFNSNMILYCIYIGSLDSFFHSMPKERHENLSSDPMKPTL